MEDFDCEKFEHRLKNLKDTQDSITGLSKWCLNKRLAHKSIVKCWLKVLKEVKIEQRLTLFYLANDVIQHSKRKNYEFVDSWATALQRASTLVRDNTRVKDKISRIFNIWQEREVYAEDFISDLHGLLSINQAKKPSTTPSAATSYTASPVSSPTQRSSDDGEDEFQLQSLISSIRSCVTLENETDKNLKSVVKASVPDIEKVRNSVKDRTHVEEVEKEVEDAAIKHELFINSISAEIKARKTLLTALDQAERFYRNQRRDVKKVVYAYKNFGDRIKSIHTELNQKITNLPSPIPSPDINAPSPEPDNDDDFDLPADINFYNPNMNGTFGSFLNDGPLPFDVNEFYRESPPPVEHNQSIQVIQSQDQQASAPLNDFYSSVMPPKMDSYNPAVNYPPVDSYRQPPLPAPAPPMNFICTAPPPPPPSSQNNNNNNQSLNSSNNDEYSPWNDWNLHHNETPVSPPNYERKAHEDSSIVEYIDDSLRDIDSSLSDIDHRQLFGAEVETKDVDHRNLISLTGSPSQNNVSTHPTNGNNDFIPPMVEHPLPQMNFPPHPMMPNFPNQHRNQRPPLLPTPNIPPARYSRNMSINSDSSKGPDDMESSEIDMELSDDDVSGLDNMSGDFYNMNQNMHGHPRYPHQMNLNRPPPSLPLDNDPMGQQRKSWIHNNVGNQDMAPLDDIDLPDQQQGMGNFMPQNNRNFHRGPNFPRGGPPNRGGKVMRGGMNNNNGNNNSPYMNKFNNRGRGRGGFRGGNNFRGGQW